MPNVSHPAPFVGGVASATLAAVGTTLSGSPVLDAALTLVSTDAANTAVRLPADWPIGSPVVVANTTATAAVVFPNAASGTIDGLAAGAGYSIAQNKGVAFYQMSAGKWITAGA